LKPIAVERVWNGDSSVWFVNCNGPFKQDGIRIRLARPVPISRNNCILSFVHTIRGKYETHVILKVAATFTSWSRLAPAGNALATA
jgi:hypothetical protein